MKESGERLWRSPTVDAGPLPSFGHCGFLRGGEGGNPLKSRNGKQLSPAKPGRLRCGAGRPSSVGPWLQRSSANLHLRAGSESLSGEAVTGWWGHSNGNILRFHPWALNKEGKVLSLICVPKFLDLK